MTVHRRDPGMLWDASILTTMLFLAYLSLGSNPVDAQSYNLLYSFTGQADGGQPVGGLIRDAEGNLYGTTCCGGSYGAGTVFKLDTAGKETVLYSFTGGSDGDQPYASLIRDEAGNLYGTTYWGGVSEGCNGGTGCGVVFKLDTSGHETVLHAFTGTGGDGANPYDSLVADPRGVLYGTTVHGGDLNGCAVGCGTVFSVDAAGDENVLYAFKAWPDGLGPFAGLVRDDEGNLYGTTTYGGYYGQGTIFELERSEEQKNTWKEKLLYTFTGGADGGQPLLGTLLRDAQGNLFGTTVRGGAPSCSYLCGTVFELERSGQERALYGFSQGADGANPYGGVVEDEEGNLYGTTNQGGAANLGTVFKLEKSGKETVLHTFTGAAGDGAGPYNGLTWDHRGNLYGAATDGGEPGCYANLGCGVVFMLNRHH